MSRTLRANRSGARHIRTRSARTFALDEPEAGRPRDARHGARGRAARHTGARRTSWTGNEPEGTHEAHGRHYGADCRERGRRGAHGCGEIGQRDRQAHHGRHVWPESGAVAHIRR